MDTYTVRIDSSGKLIRAGGLELNLKGSLPNRPGDNGITGKVTI